MPKFNVKLQRVERYVRYVTIEADSATSAAEAAESLIESGELSFRDSTVCEADETVIEVTEDPSLEYHICRSYWTGLYYATLLGGEFDNCHGQGKTPEEAVLSLKLTVAARRRRREEQSKL